MPVSFLPSISWPLNKLFWLILIPMATGVRITTKPNGNHKRAQREQSSQPHSPNLPYEDTAKGKPCCPGSSPPSSAQWRRKDLAQPFCVGVGKEIRGETEKAQEMQTLDSGVHPECEPRLKGQARVLHLRRGEQEQEAEREPGHLCCYLCSSCSCIPFGLCTPGTARARPN